MPCPPVSKPDEGPALRSANSPQVVGPQVALPPLGGSELDEGAARGVKDAEDGDADAEDDHPVADDHPCGGSSKKQEVEVRGTPPWLTCSEGKGAGASLPQLLLAPAASLRGPAPGSGHVAVPLLGHDPKAQPWLRAGGSVGFQ